MSIFLNNFKFILPEIFLSSLILFLLVIGVFFTKIQYTKRFFGGLINMYYLILFGLSLLLLLIFFQFNCDFYILNFHYIGDRFSHFTRCLLVFFTLLVFFFSKDFIIYEKEFHFEYYILILLALLGLLLMVSSNDFIFLYLALELQSLSLYVLATSNRYNNKSIEGGLKYFIFGSLASGFFLFGISLLYGLTGITHFSELNIFLYYGYFSFDYLCFLFLSLLFILSSLFFKFSVVPFHSWTPDVYEGAPFLITMFFAIVPKIGVFFLLLKFLSFFYIHFFYIWHLIFLICGLSSIILGSIGALAQFKLKRLLAYSTITHVGYILISLSIGTFEGYHAAIMYLVIYLILNLGFFGILLSLRKFNGILLETVQDLTIIFRTNPILAIMLIFILFSIAGIPPLLGFFSKFYIIIALISSHMYLVAFICLFVGVYSCIYYIRLIKIIFFEKPYIWGFNFQYNIININYILVFITIFNFFSFFFIEILLNITRNIFIRFFF